jgi:multisubunit Na+/H+ antiporter MnhB subunit
MKTGIKKFWNNTEADVNMILAAVVAAISLAISVIIVFNVIASVDTTSIDSGLTGTPAANSTTNLLSNVEIFYTIAPITLIVIGAVGILSYILLLRRQ